jgi:hypothetical protein
MAIRYKLIEELFNEGTAMERGNTACAPSLTKPTEMSVKGEKASIQDCKGSRKEPVCLCEG